MTIRLNLHKSKQHHQTKNTSQGLAQSLTEKVNKILTPNN